LAGWVDVGARVAIGPMYEVAATTSSYHMVLLACDLLAYMPILMRSALSFSTLRRRMLGKSPVSFPSIQKAMRPSRLDGVFTLTMSS